MIDQKLRSEYITRLEDKGYIYMSEIQVSDVDEMLYSLIESGEYFIDLTPEKKVWVIRRDHNFTLSKSIKTTNFWMRLFTGIVAGASLASLAINIRTLQLQNKQGRIKQTASRTQIEMPIQPIHPAGMSFSLKDKAPLDSAKKTK